MPGSGSLPATKAILIVIDGLTPAMFEDAVERRSAPALAELFERGSYARASTVFPSLTPVCLSSLVTGAYPDVHEIPHLVWYHRSEERLVEYGSSFAALRRAGARRGIVDAIFNMNAQHLSKRAVTLYESLEDADLVSAAVNIVAYRGRTPHAARIPGITRVAYGPRRFFYFNLFESDQTGAPFRMGARHLGANDRYAAAVGRWLVTRDGFDLLVYYLPDYDYASHAAGPDAAHEALGRADDAVGALVDAAGGIDELLERYAVVVCSDHGQTHIEQAVSLQAAFTTVDDVVVTASNRAGMVYDLGGGRARELAERLDGTPGVDVVLFLEDDAVVARRDGGEGLDVLASYPDGLARATGALRNPNAGDVLVSAAPGFEFADLAGRHHVGGGSHGSLVAGDSEVPMLTVGLPAPPAGVTGVAPMLLDHLGVERPEYARTLSHVG
jgi:predicted AlkP superfamily pyrophosphatase or phosphodiesterase